jgi:hypothetical protein
MGDGWDRFNRRWDSFWDVLGIVVVWVLFIYSMGRTAEAAHNDRYPEAIFYLLVLLCSGAYLHFRNKKSNGGKGRDSR